MRPGIVAIEHFRAFRDAFDERNLGDYALVRIEHARAEGILLAAEHFVAEMARLTGTAAPS